jgi:predicted ATP-binding protein involved in virulence
MAKSKGTSEKPAANGPPAEAGRQAAYFLSLSLENVRCIGPKQTLDLSDGHGKPARWTIILGVNGTGKTTVLQSLVGFEWSSVSFAKVSIASPRFASDRLLDTGTFARGDRNAIAFLNARVVSTPALHATPSRTVDYYCRLQGASTRLDSNPEIVTGNTLWCCAYGAGRRAGAASLIESIPDDPTISLFSDKAELRNAEEWLLQLDYAAAKASNQTLQKAQLERVKDLLLNVLVEVDDIRFTSTTGTHPKPRVEFKTPYGWVPFRQLGYGYQTLITWVADLASRMVERYPDSPDPFAEPAVVLVDEIDLHLHPQWQRKIIGFLTERFPNTQFIATAHSPLMAQVPADGNLAVLRREGDHVVIDNDVDAIRNWRVDQILTSELFGLETARPPHIEPLLKERAAILTKPKLTKADDKRLKELEAQIGELPTGATAQEVREREEIRKTLDLLKESLPPRK